MYTNSIANLFNKTYKKKNLNTTTWTTNPKQPTNTKLIITSSQTVAQDEIKINV